MEPALVAGFCFFGRGDVKIALILNRHAGTLRGTDADAAGNDIAGIFRDAGHEVTLTVAAGEAAIDAIRRSTKDKGTDAIVVGGGDGTISAAAGAAAATGMALGILPLGTMNFFARSLAIPADMKEAAAALAAGEIRAVDIGKANGRTFIHAVSLGLHPAMVAEREHHRYGSRIGKMMGSLRAWTMVLREPQRFRLAIASDGQKIEMRTAGVVVSNNPLGKGHLPYADRLDGGVLGLYVTTAKTRGELLRVTAAAAVGTLADNPLVEARQTSALEIAVRQSRSVPVTIDGELIRLPGMLSIESVPGGLKVLAPRLAE